MAMQSNDNWSQEKAVIIKQIENQTDEFYEKNSREFILITKHEN